MGLALRFSKLSGRLAIRRQLCYSFPHLRGNLPKKGFPMMELKHLLVVMAGGSLGALSRYSVGLMAARW